MTDAGPAQVMLRLGWRPEQGLVGKEWSPGHRVGSSSCELQGALQTQRQEHTESSEPQGIAHTGFNLSLAGFGAQEIPERGQNP